jgi:hypothetical protein
MKKIKADDIADNDKKLEEEVAKEVSKTPANASRKTMTIFRQGQKSR